MKLLMKSTVMGIVTLIIGSLVGFILGRLFGIDLPDVCKKWNKNHIMEISLFLTGFFTHILCEFIGINKIYCRKGHACL